MVEKELIILNTRNCLDLENKVLDDKAESCERIEFDAYYSTETNLEKLIMDTWHGYFAYRVEHWYMYDHIIYDMIYDPKTWNIYIWYMTSIA